MDDRNTQFVALWLEGPMQSWGSESKFFNKETLTFPTKSAIFGMILSAMGKRGAQVDLLSQLSGYDFKVFGYGVGGDMFTMEDFQVVGAGYDFSDPWQDNLVPKRGDGRRPSGVSGAKLMYKHYLQNAAFGLVVEVPNDFVNDVANALIQPTYDMFLGRKNCIPTEFVYQGTYGSSLEAERQIQHLSTDKGLTASVSVLQGVHDGGEVISLSDDPIQFGLNKKYKLRTVTISK